MTTADELLALMFTKQYWLKQRDCGLNLERYLACSTPCPEPPAEAKKHGMADNSSF